MPGRIEFEWHLRRPGAGPEAARPRQADAPLRLLVLADFGAARRDRLPLAERTPQRIDLDRFDAVLAGIAPELALEIGGERVVFAPRSIEDFHPDRLLTSLPSLEHALAACRRLADPRQFAAATADLLGPLLHSRPVPKAALPASAAAALPGTEGAPSAAGAIDALVHAAVAPHVQPDAPPQQAALVAAAEDALARQLRALLHDPAFQALEAAWRGADLLVSRLELDEVLQLYLFDVTRDELRADVVAAQGRIEQTGLYRTLVDRWRNQPGGEGWSVLIAAERFGPSDADIGLLAALGIVASQAGGPLLADGDRALARSGAPGDAVTLDGWQALRASEVASWIGLVAPRLLLRRPYGSRSDRVEAFAFEELGDRPGNDEYLWGAGALGAGLLLGLAFQDGGWAFGLDAAQDLDGLPACTREGADGEPELVPCAEAFLGEQEAQAMLDAGLMPLLSHRQRPAARLMRWQSIATPPAPLARLPH